MEVQNTKTDVAIIGAGPVGLFAVFQCGMLGLKSVVLDSLSEIGGQCTALYPEKPIYDIPSRPNVTGAGLIEALEAQAAPFQPEYRLGLQVQSLDGDVAQGFTLGLSDGTHIRAGAVIIAAGAGCFGPNRPPLEGIEACEGRSVHYMVRQMQKFKGKNIAVAGGGDAALDWVVALADIAGHITMIHRRDKFRAAQASVDAMHDLVKAGKVTLKTPYQMTALTHCDGQIETLHLQAIGGDMTESISVDALLPFYGLAASLGPLADWGLDIQGATIQCDPVTAQTPREGIYAVGDIAGYPGKLKLILTGFSETAFAAHHIRKRANGGQDLHMEYSTTKGIPKNAA